MKKEDLMKIEGMTDDLATKIAEASAEELKGYIPKTRFDEVNEAKKKAEAIVAERDKQLEVLKKASGDAEALKAEIAKLQDENKAVADRYKADLKALLVNSIVERDLFKAGAKNIKAAKALIVDLDKAELDGENVKGLADQIKKLQEDEGSKFLFEDRGGQLKGFVAGQKRDDAPVTLGDGASYAAKYNAQFVTPKA